MSDTKTLAWHFLADNGRLLDGRDAPPDGEWLTHDGEIRICRSGLHASRHVSDALGYAPGALLCRVEMDGIEMRESDKIVGRRRRIVWRADATQMLRDHARWCARQVLHLWDAPEVVVRYLRTGDEAIRAAATAAARDAARAAGWGEAWAAARAAARAAGWDAAWDTGWDAARDAARDAAIAEAMAAGWDAAAAWAAGWMTAKEEAMDRSKQRRDLSRRAKTLGAKVAGR